MGPRIIVKTNPDGSVVDDKGVVWRSFKSMKMRAMRNHKRLGKFAEQKRITYADIKAVEEVLK